MCTAASRCSKRLEAVEQFDTFLDIERHPDGFDQAVRLGVAESD